MAASDVQAGWKERWEQNTTGWHRSVVDPNLQHYLKDLTRGEPSVSIFVPWCGKSVDLPWLCDQGHNVVGVELSEIGVRSLFEEINIPYTVSQEGPFSVYQAKEKKLKVLAGDFYKITPDLVGTFEAVWDINAFGAAEPGDRQMYMSIVESVLKPKGRILLCNWEYGKVPRDRAPYTLSSSLIKELYQEKFDVEFLIYSDLYAENFVKKFKLDWAHLVLNLLTKK